MVSQAMETTGTMKGKAFWCAVLIAVQALAGLALRFALALPFWKSGLTRWDGVFQLRAATFYFYEQLYKPTLFGKTFSLPFPDILAYVASTAEIVLPVALVIGLATRLSALGLLAMTLVIYTTYQSLGVSPDQWQTETLPWGAMALALVGFGPGRISIDYLIRQAYKRRHA